MGDSAGTDVASDDEPRPDARTEAGPDADATVDSAERARDDADAADTYRGLLGAFPFAFRASGSRLFRSYVVVAGLLSGLVVVLFGAAVVVLLGNTASAQGGVFTFSRSFFIVLMLAVLAPLIGPVLSVARRHRRGGSTVAYDRALAAGGYLFVIALYLGLIISTPAEQRESTEGAIGPALEVLYALPREAGIVPPLGTGVLLYLLHRRFG